MAAVPAERRLLRGQTSPSDASALLDLVYDRFSEGFETPI
jgi:hypothetical protein